MTRIDSTWSWSRISAFFVLYGLICLYIVLFAPEKLERARAATMLRCHFQGWNYMQGETIAKRLYPDPTARWSHCGLDAYSMAIPLADGYWLAFGYVQTAKNETLPWASCFKPDTHETTFIGVGYTTEGDYGSVTRLADKAHVRPVSR